MRFQLRMYRIKPGEMDEWVEEWRERVLPLRRERGFSVVGPWIRREEDLFVWLIGHDDLEAANKAYYASPERVALDPDPARHLAETQTWILDPV
jgi:NIPSNAP